MKTINEKVNVLIEEIIKSKFESLQIEKEFDKPKYHYDCGVILMLEESYKRRTGDWYYPMKKYNDGK